MLEIIIMILVIILAVLILSFLYTKKAVAMNLNSLNLNFDLSKFSGQLGTSESSNSYLIKNSIGALGKYQFMPATIRQIANELKIPTPTDYEFLHSPELQERFFVQYVTDILYDIYYNYNLDYYLGTYIKGRTNGITANINIYGLVAGAWLGGIGGLKELLRNKVDRNDGHTYISDYVAKFSKLNTLY